jgi:hypothetical protein
MGAGGFDVLAGQAGGHEPDPCHVDHGFGVGGLALLVAGQGGDHPDHPGAQRLTPQEVTRWPFRSGLVDSGMQLVIDGRVFKLSDASGSFKYSSERQRNQNVGPIPAGRHWVDPSQLVDMRSRWLYGLLYEDLWGTHRLTVHPYGGTPTFGRGGFFIHGGATAGSKGCIDLTSEMASFARAISITPAGQRVDLNVEYTGVP